MSPDRSNSIFNRVALRTTTSRKSIKGWSIVSHDPMSNVYQTTRSIEHHLVQYHTSWNCQSVGPHASRSAGLVDRLACPIGWAVRSNSLTVRSASWPGGPVRLTLGCSDYLTLYWGSLTTSWTRKPSFLLVSPAQTGITQVRPGNGSEPWFHV